jgi:dihydrofolate reductase
MRHGLVDEFRILVHPVVLGQGRPLFEAPDVRMDLRLEETRTFGSGVVLLHYSRDGQG